MKRCHDLVLSCSKRSDGPELPDVMTVQRESNQKGDSCIGSQLEAADLQNQFLWAHSGPASSQPQGSFPPSRVVPEDSPHFPGSSTGVQVATR